jgi:hypothetical protein
MGRKGARTECERYMLNFGHKPQLEELNVDGRIILKLKLVLNKQNIGMWTEFIWIRTDISGAL